MINKPIYGGFDRFGRFPIDSSSVFETEAEIQTYLASEKTNAYPGQLISTLDGKVWMVKKNESDVLYAEEISSGGSEATGEEFTIEEKNKLSGIDEGANNYVLPSDVLKKNNVVDNLTSTEIDLPPSANQVRILNETKVDKVEGKNLSTNDYENEDKAKVDIIVNDGDGTKFLSNDGSYKVGGGGGGGAVSIELGEGF